MFFSNEWIKNVALISNDLRIADKIADIYLVYGELLTIQEFLSNYNPYTCVGNEIDYAFGDIERLFTQLSQEKSDSFSLI